MLFDNELALKNKNCSLRYQSDFIDSAKTSYYFKNIRDNVSFSHDQSFIYGKRHITKRKISWQSYQSANFKYSGVNRESVVFDENVLELMKLIELKTGNKFNSCLLNLYHNGSEGMSWHTDKTKEFGDNTNIAVISLGEDRLFDIRSYDKTEKIRINLENGSLLVMGGEFQKHYMHQIPKQLKIKKPRLSLTFRWLK